MLRDGVAQGTVTRELVPAGVEPAASPEEMKRRVGNLSPGTYVLDILAAQDSALYRWPERRSNALRVWIEPTAAVADWSEHYPHIAREVFAEWGQAGFPLTFAFVYDSASADITIRWHARFPAEEGQRIGLTERIQSRDFLITHARVGIANHDSTGRALSPTTVGGIIRHEVGHALGLNHSSDRTSVMYRESATSTIGVSDRATLRLLYLVPGGSLK